MAWPRRVGGAERIGVVNTWGRQVVAVRLEKRNASKQKSKVKQLAVLEVGAEKDARVVKVRRCRSRR